MSKIEDQLRALAETLRLGWFGRRSSTQPFPATAAAPQRGGGGGDQGRAIAQLVQLRDRPFPAGIRLHTIVTELAHIHPPYAVTAAGYR